MKRKITLMLTVILTAWLVGCGENIPTASIATADFSDIPCIYCWKYIEVDTGMSHIVKCKRHKTHLTKGINYE